MLGAEMTEGILVVAAAILVGGLGWWMVRFFGRSARARRQRIREEGRMMEELIAGNGLDNPAMAGELACLPQRIGGVGHVKEKAMHAAQREQKRLRALLNATQIPVKQLG